MWELDNEVDARCIATGMLRAFRHMTQDELAGAAGLTQGTVSALESGAQALRPGTFEQVVQGVDVDEELVDELLRWIRKARTTGMRRAAPQSRRWLAEAASAELTDALEELLEATGLWIEERRGE